MALQVLFDGKRRQQIRGALERGEAIPLGPKKLLPEPLPPERDESAEQKPTSVPFPHLFHILGVSIKQQLLDERLINAIENGDLAAVTKAISDGANPNADDRMLVPDNTCRPYKTALAIAREKGFVEIEKLLVSHGAK